MNALSKLSPLSLAALLALGTGPAAAADRYWSFASGCPTLDFTSTCWRPSLAGVAGVSPPVAGDNVFIVQSAADELTVRLANSATPLLPAYQRLTLTGTGTGPAGLSIERNQLQVADAITVGSAGRGRVTQSGGKVSAARLLLGSLVGGAGAWELSGGELNASDILRVGGENAMGRLTQTGGLLTTPALMAGSTLSGPVGNPGDTAEVTLLGGTVNLANVLFAGYRGDANVPTPAYGTVTINGANVAARLGTFVSPLGTLNIRSGSLKAGDLFLASPGGLSFTGGTLEITGTPDLGTYSAAPSFGSGFGTGNPLLVLAPGSQAVFGTSLDVGSFGRGELQVGAGAVLQSRGGSLGKGMLGRFAGDGQAIIEGANTRWTVVGNLDVGVLGTGRLQVLGGGTVSNVDGFMGRTFEPDPTLGRNTAVVSGAGSLWLSSGNLTVGGTDTYAGRGSDLAVSAGGRVQAGGTLRVWGGSSLQLGNGASVVAAQIVNLGTIDMQEGGNATLQGALTLGPGGTLIASSTFASLTLNGTLDVKGGGVLEGYGPDTSFTFNGAVRLRKGAVLLSGGTKFFNAGLVIGDPFTAIGAVGGHDGGLADIGDPGSARFGDGGVFEFELATGGDSDRYRVAGTLRLGGTLRLLPLAGYAGLAGDRFDLLDGAISGSFATIDTSAFPLGTGLVWNFSLLSSSGVVSIDTTAPAVPEPGTWALLLAGLAAVGRVARGRSGGR